MTTDFIDPYEPDPNWVCPEGEDCPICDLMRLMDEERDDDCTD